MKKYFLFFLLLTLAIQAQDHNDLDFSSFDKKGMKTSLLVTQTNLFSPLGKNQDQFGMYDFEQAYKDLKSADYKGIFFAHSDLLQNELKLETTSEMVKIGFLHANFEVINKNAYSTGKIKVSNNKVKRLSNEYIFDYHSATIISPLTIRKKGSRTIFQLDSDFFINTTQEKISSIHVDFDNGNGFVPLLIDQKHIVEYNSEGVKTLHFEILFENGNKVQVKSNLTVTYSNSDINRLFRRAVNLVESTRIPDLAIYGETNIQKGKCEYEFFLSPDNILDKPIFVIDGFDPTDSRNTTAIYNVLTYVDGNGITRNLGDRIRQEEGYDVIIVNFPNYTNAANVQIDGGADFIERNALSVVTVIELINAQKTGTEENVVIGSSMGGLISRYALRYMEQNNILHQTRLWVSFDSPHYGANVPIGLQHLFNYFAYGKPNSTAVQPLINGMLRSAAAKQMLVDHFQAHISTGANTVFPDNTVLPSSGLPLTPAGYPGFRDNFQNRMNALGFPQNTRNISMVNGSGSLARYKAKDGVTDVTPGFDFIGTASSPHTIELGNISLWVSARAKTFCEFMPNANVQEQIVDVTVEYNPFFFYTTYDTFKATAKQSPTSNGVDSSPAGLFDLGGLASSLGSGNATLTNFLNAMKADKFSFIPVTSAMGLNLGGNSATPQPNYYFNINLGAKDLPWDGITTATSNTTPFKNWYMPPTNEMHVTVTPANVDFVWCEIVKPDVDFNTTGSDSFVACQGTNAVFTFSNNLHGCNAISYLASGLPSGASVAFSPSVISADGAMTATISNLPPGIHTITITPVGFPSKAKTVTVTINPTNPNLIGTTQYSINNATFLSGNNVTVAHGSRVELQIPSNLYSGAIQWFDPTGVPRSTTNPIIASIQDGSVDEGVWNAQVTFDTDCPRTSPLLPITVQVEAPLSINSADFNALSIYPNPTIGLLTIASNSDFMSSDSKIKIVDWRGRIVFTKKIDYTNQNLISLDISELAQGSYLLIFESEKSKVVKTIIKQ